MALHTEKTRSNSFGIIAIVCLLAIGATSDTPALASSWGLDVRLSITSQSPPITPTTPDPPKGPGAIPSIEPLLMPHQPLPTKENVVPPELQTENGEVRLPLIPLRQSEVDRAPSPSSEDIDTAVESIITTVAATAIIVGGTSAVVGASLLAVRSEWLQAIIRLLFK